MFPTFMFNTFFPTYTTGDTQPCLSQHCVWQPVLQSHIFSKAVYDHRWYIVIAFQEPCVAVGGTHE